MLKNVNDIALTLLNGDIGFCRLMWYNPVTSQRKGVSQ